MVKDNIKYEKNHSTGKKNEGFRINAQSSTAQPIKFGSKDNPDVSKRPRLMMTYSEYVFTPYPAETRLRLTNSYIKLDYGKSQSISGYVQTTPANKTVTYTSLNPDIATVNSTGTVTASSQNEGLAVIEIKRIDTGDKVYLTVDVSLHIELMEDDTDYVQQKAIEKYKGNSNQIIWNRVQYKNSIFYEMFGREARWYNKSDMTPFYGTSTVNNIASITSEAEYMFGGHTDPEEVKRFAYYLIGTALTVACFIPGSAVVQGIVSLTASAVNVGMALDLMVTSVKDGEAPKLGDTIWFIGSVISGVVNAVKLGNAIKLDVNAKNVLTSLDEGANITIKGGTKATHISAGLGSDLNEGLGTYANQQGHHLMSKKAFEGVAGYDPNSAVTVSNAQLKLFDVKHTDITGQQHALYSAFSKTGQPFTMEAMRKIEIQALVNAKIPADYATYWVDTAIDDLLRNGITTPVKIPWG